MKKTPLLTEQIVAAVHKQGETQRAIATKLHISYVHMSHLMTGKSQPSLKLIARMGKLFRCTFTIKCQ